MQYTTFPGSCFGWGRFSWFAVLGSGPFQNVVLVRTQHASSGFV